MDDVWTIQIANLGIVKYVFEVQKGGSPDSLILNLQKARNDPSVQKVIVVSDSEQLEKIREEIMALSTDFSKNVSYWEASDVKETYNHLTKAIDSIRKLDLVMRS